MMNFTECFAVPGEGSIIDGINPETGRSIINDQTFEQIQARYPNAVVMAWEDWRAAQIAKQQTPVRWSRVTERQYQEMLEVLPPAAWMGGYFLVGEPDDHCMATGRPRFRAYGKRGHVYTVSSRPMTVAELKTYLSR